MGTEERVRDVRDDEMGPVARTKGGGTIRLNICQLHAS